ncbi:RagB/SusD family nutrient uptake outer membrane protein [Labilibacter sediminis]|nr:RagB/SusD family nutrient uptake outer membrane protein [Labilibacter sediminis]
MLNYNFLNLSIMKTKFKYILSILLAGVLLSSCNDFLEEHPQSFISPDNFFNNKEEADIALIGVYDAIGTNKGWGLYAANMLIIDQGTSLSSSRIGNLTQGGIAHYLAATDYKVFTEIWENSYDGIQRANTVINRVGQMDKEQIDELNQLRIIAEAKFLRALHYFNLVRLYGGVPVLAKETTDMDNVLVGRNTTEDVYYQIIGDLEYAAENLFYRTNSANTPKLEITGSGRATKGAALGLLSKVYLTLASTKKYASTALSNYKYANYDWVDVAVNYQKATQYAGAVIQLAESGGGINLLDDYSQIFMTENHNESLFEVQFGPELEEGGYVAYWAGPLNADKYAVDRGQARINATPEFSDSFIKAWSAEGPLVEEESDFRYSWNIGKFKYAKKQNKLNLAFKKEYCYRKYRKTETYEFADVQNFPVLRYADVLLMLAEAHNELGTEPDSVVWAVNKIRERARKGSASDMMTYPASNQPADMASGLDQETVRNIIIKERGWELCHEGQARFDDVRLGQLEKAVTAQVDYSKNTAAKGADKPIKFYVDGRNEDGLPTSTSTTGAQNFDARKHWLFPIPQFERDVNPNLEQNGTW